MEKEIDVEAFLKAWLSYEEIESVKRWLEDIKSGRTVSFDDIKKSARKKIFSKDKVYA